MVVLPVNSLQLFGYIGRIFFRARRLAKGISSDVGELRGGLYFEDEDMEANLKLGFTRA